MRRALGKWILACRGQSSGAAIWAPLDSDEDFGRTLEFWLENSNQMVPHPTIPGMGLRAGLLREVMGSPFDRLIRHDQELCPQCGAPWNRSVWAGTCHVCQNGHDWSVVPRGWLTPDVLAMVRSMRDSHDYGAMPYLGDALKEAGCDQREILWHCAGLERCVGHAGCCTMHTACRCHGSGTMELRAPHVDGCWVVELLGGQALVGPSNR